MEYTLRFNELDIVNIAEKYNYEPNETTILDMVQEIQDKKYLDYNNLQKFIWCDSCQVLIALSFKIRSLHFLRFNFYIDVRDP